MNQTHQDTPDENQDINAEHQGIDAVRQVVFVIILSFAIGTGAA